MKLAALVACLAVFSATASAAGISVSATLNADQVVLGDQIVLSIAINGSGSASPKTPLVPGVEIYESGKSQSMTIVNGRVASSVVYTFVLNPQKAGKFVVPPIEVPGAQPTAAMSFTVAATPPPATTPAPQHTQPPQAVPPSPSANPTPGAASPARRPPVPGAARGNPDVFVTATLEKPRAFVNEQVTLVVRFFTSIPLLGPPQYDSPKLTGVLSENIGAEAHGTTTIDGRAYNYSELKSALFPVQAGRAVIGSAVVAVQVPSQSAPRTGDDFFDRFFNMSVPEGRRLQTDPIPLQVDALPPGAPSDFSGIVGTLSVEASVDRTRVKAGEAVNLTVVVKGMGNIKTVPEPKRPDMPAVRFFDSESSVKLERYGDKLGGAKIFKTVLVPRVSGPLELPSLSISYFDATKAAYETARSKPITLTVLPGDPNAALPVVGPGNASAPGVTEVSADIRYLKGPRGSAALRDALSNFGAPRPWHAVPALFFIVALLLEARRRMHASDPRARRASDALATAERRLKRAEAHTDTALAISALGEALLGYFADTLDQPAASLTLKFVTQRLSARRPPADAAAQSRLKSLWDELDLLRYAPGAAGQAEVKRLADEIRGLTRALDKERRS